MMDRLMFNNHNARILTPKDLDAVLELDSSQQKIMSRYKDVEYQQNTVEQVEFILNGSRDQYILIGTFENDKLIATVGGTFWPSMPFWAKHLVKTRKVSGLSQYNVVKNGIAASIMLMFDIAESQGRFVYYKAQSLKHYNAWLISLEKTQFKKGGSINHSYPGRGRYSYFLETIVPANERPKYDYQWKIMWGRIQPFDTAIIFASLDNDKRHNLLNNISR
jgi:hypothetical protein